MIHRISIRLVLVILVPLVGCREKQPHSSAQAAAPKSAAPQADQTSSSQGGVVNQSGALSELPGSRAALEQRIGTELTAMMAQSPSGLDRQFWAKMRRRYWLPELNVPIDVVPPAAAKKSIDELMRAEATKSSIFLQFLAGEFDGAASKEMREFLIAYQSSMLVLLANGAGSLPFAFSLDQTTPNVTRGELLLFGITDAVFREGGNPTKLSVDELAEWNKMAKSRNELIRLVGLRTFRRASNDPKTWVEYYANYVGETDQEILDELLKLSLSTGRSEAADLLVSMRGATDQAANPAFAAKLESAIEWVTKNYPQKK